ncbi:hypothetical protein MVI27_07735 [Chryseobacterium salipaludis]|uniref:hypothetical protein n=1 Tax=Chryseobacterium TaxID=59732 RepID=UPI001FF5D804|nr:MULTISPECIES: hypothetical protein [Chryseobacterium]MCJ8498148.1 hypothetical protein [Chryseobacterium salipaludis]MCX3296654.1 hypothetical protein [Planobacterium sp. JC490]
MPIYRLHIRPKGGTANTKTVFDYCLKNNFLGVGWRVTKEIGSMDWENYSTIANSIFGKVNTVNFLRNRIKKDDLIWTRNHLGEYYLAKVKSEWSYFNSVEANKEDIDIGNVVGVDFIKIPTDQVPGKVIACFRPTRTLQTINSSQVDDYSKFLWNEKSKINKYEALKTNITGYFDFIDSEELEDVIFIYLQMKNFLVVPNSRKGDTMSYEFFAINKESKDSFFIQVKSGMTRIDLSTYKDSSENFILFQPHDLYINREFESDKISIIDSNTIKNFIEKNFIFLPKTIQKKIEIIKKTND